MNLNKLVNNSLKNTDQNVVNQVRKMLDHFEVFNFLIKSGESIKFGFNLESLKHLVKNEWLLTNTICCDHPAFQFKSLKEQIDFKNAFERVKSLTNTVPFSFVEVDHEYTNENQVTNFSTEADVIDVIQNLFKTSKGTILRNQTLCSPSTALEFFHKQQRDRKIWWRMLSALPGRFHTTKIFTDKNNKSQFVEIQAEFPWGLETIETVTYLPDMLNNDDSFFEMKSQRKKIIPQVVTCETLLDKVSLTYLCDSYEGINEKTDREVLKFSRKLAPFKIAFAGSGSSAEINQNLKELALLLAKKIRKRGISVILLSDMCSAGMERQFLRNDAIGVPYTILLSENTLKDGIVTIRSRDTTLKEQSHVSLVVSYIEKLIKS